MIRTLSALCSKIFGINLHEVDPGRVYRVARGRVGEPRFTELLKNLKIRTVVDLRRANAADGRNGAVDFASLGVAYENVHVRSSELPFPEKLLRFVEILDRAEYPVLLYCKRGTDKSGFGSMLYLMLVKGQPWALARSQLAFVPFGHKKRRHEGPWKFMRLLDEEKVSPAELRGWIRDRYPVLFRRERGDEDERASASGDD